MLLFPLDISLYSVPHTLCLVLFCSSTSFFLHISTCFPSPSILLCAVFIYLDKWPSASTYMMLCPPYIWLSLTLNESLPRSLCLLYSLSLLLLCIWNKSNVYMWLCSLVHMDKPCYPHSWSFPYSGSLNSLHLINLPCNLLLLIKLRHTVCLLRHYAF